MDRPCRTATLIVLARLCLASLALAQQPDPGLRLLTELVNANGASGFEGPVRDILRREWQGLLQDVRADGMGNLLGTLPGPGGSPKVLLMAHMDEVGFLVRYIDERGFVYMNNVGGYIDQSVLTQRFTITTPQGPVVGYTGMKSGHIVSADERNRLVPLQDMFLDIGARSREEAEKLGVRPGLPVTYRTELEPLNGTGRYLARAWDDRIGLAAITEALRQVRSHPNTIQVAATVQEENGLRGAAVVYPSTNPDIVINLEIGIATDFPLLTSPKLAQEALGKGPALFVFDGSMIPNNKFVDWIVKVARESNIPIQFESVSGYGEDGSILQRSAQGIPAINLGVPTRYAHSQSGVIDRADYDNTVKLLVQMLQKLSAAEVRSIREF
ncbi:MAG: M42 family metallopeptidase [Gemmatimonadetes bacterium]|nr:M42 family metallopeptidase [Gemmatimonadota bacterium]